MRPQRGQGWSWTAPVAASAQSDGLQRNRNCFADRVIRIGVAVSRVRGTNTRGVIDELSRTAEGRQRQPW